MGAVIAGLGMRRGCPAGEIVALVRRAALCAGRDVSALAAPAFKQGECCVQAAADELGMAVVWVSEAALAAAQPGCVTRSAVAARAVGVASVAEGSALAAAGDGALLLLPRIAGARATCALAERAA